MFVSRFSPRSLLPSAAALALAALGWCASDSTADEPSAAALSAQQADANDLLAVLQDRDDGPRRGPEGGARSGGPDRRPDEGRPGARGRRGGGDRPPDGDRPRERGPGDRQPDDRPPGDRGPDGPRADERPRGPDDQPRPGARSGGSFGRGGFGPEGPRFGPPGGPMSGPGGLDARIARLEQKLDAVLSELRELRRDRSPPRFADRGPRPVPGYGMRGGGPRGPMGPPSFDRDWRDGDRFGPPARRWEGPPDQWRDGGPPRGDGPRGGGPRGGGPPRGAERDRRGDDDLTF